MAHTLLNLPIVNVSLYQAAAAMSATDRWQEMIAENLASNGVPGFKKREMIISALEAGKLPAGTAQGVDAPKKFVIPTTSVGTDFRPGELRFTGVSTNLAVDGPGFFEVQLPDGRTSYTRDGQFNITTGGQLVTKQGFPVLGEGGPIQVDMSAGTPVTISETGMVTQGALQRGRLKLTEFDSPKLLTQISGASFTAEHPDLVPKPAENSSVRQGFLESANTSVVVEMAGLMAALRASETNQRVIQLNDERMGRSISELGNPT